MAKGRGNRRGDEEQIAYSPGDDEPAKVAPADAASGHHPKAVLELIERHDLTVDTAASTG